MSSEPSGAASHASTMRAEPSGAPLVSVIVPAFNCERYLPEALASIHEQRYAPLETIVVDDGSSDSSAAIARAHGARVIRLRHRGIAHARNTGLEAARGQLIAFLDADDIWTTNSLRARVDRLSGRADLDAVSGMMGLFVEPGVPTPAWFRAGWDSEPQHALLGGWLARPHVFERVGVFDSSYEVGEDTDWLARFKDSGLKHERIPDVVLRYRHHGANTTRARDPVARNLLRALKASIDRQRLRGA